MSAQLSLCAADTVPVFLEFAQDQITGIFLHAEDTVTSIAPQQPSLSLGVFSEPLDGLTTPVGFGLETSFLVAPENPLGAPEQLSLIAAETPSQTVFKQEDSFTSVGLEAAASIAGLLFCPPTSVFGDLPWEKQKAVWENNTDNWATSFSVFGGCV